MASLSASTEARPVVRFALLLEESRGAAVAALLVLACFVLQYFMQPQGIGYYDISTLASNAAPLVIGALGLSIVVLTGGLDLSPGAVISLVNVGLVRFIGDADLGFVSYSLAAVALALGIGAACGAISGLLVGYAKLQSVVVTLALMFIAQGAALLVMATPGGSFSDVTSNLFIGDAIPGILPAPVVVILIALALWLIIARLKAGVLLRAVGSDAGSARLNSLNVNAVRFFSYVLAGLFYGLAGLTLTANMASGDPLIGTPMLLKLFTAVVLGGVAIGGGRGTPVGAIFGALILTALTNILLISGVRTYYVPVVEGIVLLVAVLAFSASRSMPVSLLVRHILHGGRRRAKPSAVTNGAMLLAAPGLVEVKKVGWQRHIPFLRMVVPAIVLCLIAVGATAIVSGSGFSFASYFVSMLVFASFLAVVGLGQGAVVISGGLDLSVAWTITLPAVIITTFSSGLDASIVWVVPLALAVGAGVGVLNGALVVGCGISPIIVTLGVAGILEGLTLVVSGGAPTGYVPPALSAFVNGSFLGLQPLLWFMLVFCVGAFLLINRSVFGHRLIAVGNSVWASRLSGIRTGTVLIGAYGLSGLCAAITGVLLAGFNGQANYDMGRPYLLASIAVVVLGGTDIRGGRGHYTGILAGALLFTSLSSMLSATTLPEALRSIIYGVVLIAAVLFMRDKN